MPNLFPKHMSIDWYVCTLLEEAYDRCESKQEEEDFKEHLADDDILEAYVRSELDIVLDTWKSGKKNDSIQLFIDCALSEILFSDIRLHMEHYIEETKTFY